MGHSMATSREYYQATVSKSDSINAFERIKALGKEKRTTEEPHKRRQWSEAQTAQIHTYFHAAIEGGLTISLEEARQFLQQHPIPDRSAKDVQDKLSTIRRKSSKKPPSEINTQQLATLGIHTNARVF